MKPILIDQEVFGHQIMAVNFAEALKVPTLIIPKEDDPFIYRQKQKSIFTSLRWLTKSIISVPFENRKMPVFDIIGALKTGSLSDDMWDIFFTNRLRPQFEGPDWPEIYGKTENVLFVPQKLMSDNACGVTAQEQSLAPNVFSFLKARSDINVFLGQHFDKQKDHELVQKLADDFDLNVPGTKSNKFAYGIRGTRPCVWDKFYANMKISIGIAGTHTWNFLAMRPDVMQIIFYNVNGVENWPAIASAARRAGYCVNAIGFDEKTDMAELAEQAEWEFEHMLSYLR